jgi:tol-pal system protein YbgF
MLTSLRTFLPLKRAVLPSGASILSLALLGSMAAFAQETNSPSARLDQIESQMGTLQSKLRVAQGYGYGRPPGDVGDGDGGGYNTPPRQDAAGLEVRIGHLEEQLRQMNGQIEQMQFAQHKLEDQLKKFQQDVDFRFQDTGRGGARPQKRTEAPESETGGPAPTTTANANPDSSPSAGAPPLHGGHHGDAFDPSADPNAPGAPHQLGSIASSSTALPPPQTQRMSSNNETPDIIADEGTDPNAPLNLSSSRRDGTSTPPRQIPLTGPQTTPSATPGSTTQMADVPAIATPKEEFETALGFLKQKEYENAEKGFSAFLQKNPKNRMTPDAVYYLGETYFQRGRQREAAEQYLKISTNYSTSAHAPEAMLRLGQSLNAIGAKEQACASFSQVTVKYPNAAAWVKTSAEKESQRAKC